MVEFNSLVLSAPGKVILHGEHSVVYGKIALAASVDLRTTLAWEKVTDNTVELHLHDLQFSSSWTINQIKDVHLPPSVDVNAFKVFLGIEDISDTVFTAVWAFIYLYNSIYNKSLLPGKFILKSDIPVGSGLGSSASYCSVLATAMLITSGVFEPTAIAKSEIQCNTSRNECLKLISNWAFEAERIIHGKPSGVDNTVSTFGGFLQFQSGKLEEVKRVPELNILLVNTSVPRSTKTMVSGLRQKYEEMPKVYDHLFSAIGEISVESRRLLQQLGEQDLTEKSDSTKESDHFVRLQKLIDLNQEILRTFGVSHSVIDYVCQMTLTYGLHSKLTGAGGGGCVITLLKQDIKEETLDKLKKELKDFGCDSWRTKLGGEGIVVHKWTINENS